jgi:hypothetical protein
VSDVIVYVLRLEVDASETLRHDTCWCVWFACKKYTCSGGCNKVRTRQHIEPHDRLHLLITIRDMCARANKQLHPCMRRKSNSVDTVQAPSPWQVAQLAAVRRGMARYIRDRREAPIGPLAIALGTQRHCLRGHESAVVGRPQADRALSHQSHNSTLLSKLHSDQAVTGD